MPNEKRAHDPGAALSSGAGLSSVERAISALEHLARHPDAGVSSVATAIGVHKSTASRLLVALAGHDLVEPGTVRGHYRLGTGILRLAAAVGGRLDVSSQAAAVCAGLAHRLGETVNLAIRQDEVVVNVDQAEGGGTITVDSWVGRPTPLHATSSGKVLLAYAPEPVRARVLADLTRYTDATVTDPQRLSDQLEQVLTDGYATTIGELEVGLNAVAAPVRRADGTVIAALSVSGPAYRLPAESLPDAARATVAAAAEVSERMGYLRSGDPDMS
ncbi:IclR family transcriptional regulator [uncultured Friedmanniella sp.]|uniref:IclR family transcriptional regulator n=1 Tax=uncultured Friedmanniella sp. TaxID=335381 RepID=UPI0035CA3BC7